MVESSGLRVTGLTYAIGAKTILKDLELYIASGESCLVIGPSGSGKTTLLSIFAGLQKPDAGSVLYNGTELYHLSESQRDHFRGQHIGILFQTFHLIKPLTVRQNLLLAYSMPGKKPDIAHMNAVLERLGLKNKEAQKAGTLSVGEAQRLAVARAIVGKPQWLLCDEPTSALDDANANEMMTLLKDEAKRIGTSLIIVTHDSRACEHFTGNVLELGEMS